jgi:hypothetical protein
MTARSTDTTPAQRLAVIESFVKSFAESLEATGKWERECRAAGYSNTQIANALRKRVNELKKLTRKNHEFEKGRPASIDPAFVAEVALYEGDEAGRIITSLCREPGRGFSRNLEEQMEVIQFPPAKGLLGGPCPA